MKRRVVCLFIVCLLPFAADARATDREALVARVLDESGIASSMAAFPRQVEAQFAAVPAAAGDPGRARAVVETVLEVWDEGRVRAMLGDYVLAHTTTEELEGILEWLASDAGRRISVAEKALAVEGASESGQARMLKFLSELRAAPPDAVRADLIERLEAAAAAIETLIDMIGIMMNGALRGINALAPAHERLAPAAVEAAARATQARLRDVAAPLLREQYLLAARYAYRELTTDELERYIAFLSSGPGQAYTGIARGVAQAYAAVFDEAIRRLEGTPAGADAP